VLALLIFAGVVSSGLWALANPPSISDALVVDAASQPQIRYLAFGQQPLRYATTNSAWRLVIDRRLRERGWQVIDAPNPYDASNYMRIERVGLLTFIETIAVRGTTEQVELTIRRRLVMFGMRVP
jgi:hypothetical protein